jgi:hypothetical protein
MQPVKRPILLYQSVLKCFLLSFIFLNAFVAVCQPPIEIPEGMEGIPSNLDPKNLLQPQLRALLEDKNKESGKDKHAKFTNHIGISFS